MLHRWEKVTRNDLMHRRRRCRSGIYCTSTVAEIPRLPSSTSTWHISDGLLPDYARRSRISAHDWCADSADIADLTGIHRAGRRRGAATSGSADPAATSDRRPKVECGGEDLAPVSSLASRRRGRSAPMVDLAGGRSHDAAAGPAPGACLIERSSAGPSPEVKEPPPRG